MYIFQLSLYDFEISVIESNTLWAFMRHVPFPSAIKSIQKKRWIFGSRGQNQQCKSHSFKIPERPIRYSMNYSEWCTFTRSVFHPQTRSYTHHALSLGLSVLRLIVLWIVLSVFIHLHVFQKWSHLSRCVTNLRACIMDRSWQPRPNRWSYDISYATRKIEKWELFPMSAISTS